MFIIINKTLIGKDGYLFLCNDSSKSLEVHCKNLNLVSYKKLTQYKFENYLLFVFPNKCLIYRNFLPDGYNIKYRPSLEIYKKIFGEKMFDLYEILKNETYVYYKTDTHINLKGNYIIYKYFVENVNKKLHLNIKPKNININSKVCILKTLFNGYGDLTQDINVGEQKLGDIKDTFYFTNDFTNLYYLYVIKDCNDIRFLNYKLQDETRILENKLTSWHIISKYIIYKKNPEKPKLKVIFFYDSFLLNILPLYLELFREVYMIKSVYDNKLINVIKPDYVFEFRVERFLC